MNTNLWPSTTGGYIFQYRHYISVDDEITVSLLPLQKGVPLLQLLLFFLQRGDGFQQLHFEAAVQRFDGNMARVTHRPHHYAERI